MGYVFVRCWIQALIPADTCTVSGACIYGVRCVHERYPVRSGTVPGFVPERCECRSFEVHRDGALEKRLYLHPTQAQILTDSGLFGAVKGWLVFACSWGRFLLWLWLRLPALVVTVHILPWRSHCNTGLSKQRVLGRFTLFATLHEQAVSHFDLSSPTALGASLRQAVRLRNCHRS